MYFSYLSIPDNFTRREVRTIICAREMISSGNYLIPTLGGETRFEKPPLQYWLISLAAQFNGGVITNTISRIPSVIAGILTLLLTWWWTLRIRKDKDGKKALLSPLILSAVPLFFLDVRSSEAEIVLCFFILSASYFFWKSSVEENTRQKNLLWAYLFVSGGILTKGPLALLMPLLPYIVIRRKRFLKEWKWHVSGLIIAVLPIGLWVLASYIYYPEAIDIFIKELFVKRFGGEAKHAEPVYYYILLMAGQFIIFLPFIIPACRSVYKKEQPGTYNFYFILLNFIWLSIMSSKQDHYIIPLFPHLSIMLGLWLGNQGSRKWINTYFKILSYILLMSTILFGFMLLPKSTAILLVATGVFALATLFRKQLPIPGIWKTALIFVAMMHLGNMFVTYTANRLVAEKLMFKWVNKQPIPKDQIAFVNSPEDLLIYYLDDVTKRTSLMSKALFDTADYFLVEEDDVVRFLEDERFYLIKGIDKIRKNKTEHILALFGEARVKRDKTFAYSLLFVRNNGKQFLGKEAVASALDLQTFYAIVPETNPLASSGPLLIKDRMVWEETYRPLLNEGVELVCRFDSRSSLYRRAWFNDASCWGVTPEIIQRRSFFGDRGFLWTIDLQEGEKALRQLEEELNVSHSEIKLIYFQSSIPGAEIMPPEEYCKRFKRLGAVIVNERLFGDAVALDIKIGHAGARLRTISSEGKVIREEFYPLS